MFYQLLPIWSSASHKQFNNDYQYIVNISFPIIELVILSPLVANVLPIINSAMALKNLPIAANGLPLVPIDNNIQILCPPTHFNNNTFQNSLQKCQTLFLNVFLDRKRSKTPPPLLLRKDLW